MFALRSSQFTRRLFSFTFVLFLVCQALVTASAQNQVSGAFSGKVEDAKTGKPIAGALVRYINQGTLIESLSHTDPKGEFYQGNLDDGRYTIIVSAPNYQDAQRQIYLPTMRATVVIPPMALEPVLPTAGPVPVPTPTTPPPPHPPAPSLPDKIWIIDSVTIAADLNALDARRGGIFTGSEVAALPLGGTSFTRSYDELALLLPGVAPPPQTPGRVAGPGVGYGVGSAGQFAINGLRSRANNFTVDGSDNNDEDIGVRRQGFFTLVPQPVESIREYQVTTLLAPAQYGRNLGAQVNAVSKSGGYQTHGTFYGFLNTSDLNARDFFDTRSPGTPTPLQGLATDGTMRNVFINDQQAFVRNPAARQDSLTFAQSGFVLGGPLLPKPAAPNTEARKSAFYFFSLEGQLLNANKEVSFAVPTVEQRGINRTGASGITDSRGVPGFPTTFQGDAIFSLFPFPNNPNGIYGRNTLTQILPAGAQGNIASVKLDHNFKLANREQSMTGRYNRTDDWRNIPATGDAIFAVLRPKVRTHNFSYFWNSELSAPDAVRPIFNQFRASYGRTRLFFEEERDREFLIESTILPNTPFLLNAPYRFNNTLPGQDRVDYARTTSTTELGLLRNGDPDLGALGPVGQVVISGYSPLGVDVNNFPQRRVNNTYQLADALTMRVGLHNIALGADIRRTELNSDLPRNSRPLITFGTAVNVRADCNPQTEACTNFRFGNFIFTDTLAATSSPSGLLQTLATRTANIGLRYHQYNFFGQDEWRIRPNFSLSYGLRYEYNTTPRERQRLIENSFKDAALGITGVRDLALFINNRERIFDSDRNNFAPRVGFAYAFDHGVNKTTVVRGGYGIYYDQILGAVVSQSRNVFPNFLTLNTGGASGSIGQFSIFNPGLSLGDRGVSNGIRFRDGRFEPLVIDGSLNRFNADGIRLADLIDVFRRHFPGGFGFTLPARDLPTPLAHQYSLTVDQQLGANLALSLGYVGTMSKNLLRLTTPNLGPNLTIVDPFFRIFINAQNPRDPRNGSPFVFGQVLLPGQTISPTTGLFTDGRPLPEAGTVYLYETTAESRYDSVQAQLRGQLQTLSFQISYTFSKALDDVSDVFDLAGAPALPQNSRRPSEYGLANFDTRHRLTYNFTWALPNLGGTSKAKRLLFGGFELAGTGQFQTGQPFTINSIFDVNLDGNLTDRLNTISGLARTGDRRKPIRLTTDPSNLIAAIGRDGAVGRNTFRSSNYLLLNLALTKNFILTERQRLILRVEVFNFINRANFAIPVRYLEAPAFGESVDTLTPGRRIQFALKYSY